MTRKKILAILQLPQPKHGASFVGEQIKGSGVINIQFEITYIRISTKPQSGRKFLQPFIFCFLLFRILRKLVSENYKAVYITPCASGLQFYKDFVICMIAKYFNSNVIYHFHNKGISTNKYLNAFVKRTYFSNVKVVLLSKLLKYEVEEYVNDDSIYYCANGVSYNHSEAQAKNTLKEDGVKILFLSNMIRSKGVFVLLEACTILRNKNINFKCQFVGPWYDDIEQEFFSVLNKGNLKSYVSYLGPKYGIDKEAVFRSSDIFVFPTFYPDECFPLVNLEAMRYGLPVISTDEGGIPEIIRDGKDGFIVERRNAKELAERLETLINDSSLLANMSKNARERYQQNYTEDHFVSRFVEIINRVIDN